MSTKDTPQNIYDEPGFFAGYSSMERFGAGWETAMEQPSFLALLPELAGKRVLDLGCGAGRLCLHLAESGAAEVVGVDVSNRMLGIARQECSHPKITYHHRAMEQLEFPPNCFDLVVSSLAFHYVRDYRSLVRSIAHWLADEGVLVFSTEHPLFTARASDDGWVLGPNGERSAWALDYYSAEGFREHRWFGAAVQRYHRTMATLINTLLDAGFTLERLVEPVPSDEWLRERPGMEHERRRPIFVLVRACKTRSMA